METVQESKEIALEDWSASRADMLRNMATQAYSAGRLEQAEAKAVEAADMDPNNPETRLFLSRIYIERGKYRSAETALAALARETPKTADVHYLTGIVKEKQGHLTEAFEAYRRASQLEESNIAPVTAAAEVLVSSGNPEQAWRFLEPRLNRDNNEAGTFELAGRISMMLGRYEKAAEFFHEARLMDVKNLKYLEMLAEAQFYSGNCIEALRWLDVIRRNEKYRPSFNVEMMRGDCLLALGQPPRAIEAYEEAAEIDGENADAWNNIAKASLINGDPAQAAAAARKAMKVRLHDADAVLLLAAALMRQEKYTEAIRELEDAGAWCHKDRLYHRLRGKAYEKSGDMARARACYAVADGTEPAGSK
jgi:tetratricopeptide (TPR) repeat protein